MQLAARLYPGHAVLQLHATTTSSIQAALQRAFVSTSSSGVLVLLHSKVVDVDAPLSLRPGQRLVLATPAALQAAMADTVAVRAGRQQPKRLAGLPEAQLVSVRCSRSRSGGFLAAT